MPSTRLANLLTSDRLEKAQGNVLSGFALTGDQADSLNVYYVVIKPGFVDPNPHYHVHSENVFVVLSGTLTIVVDGDSHELVKNDFVFIPKGAHHACSNYGKEDVTCIEIYSPPKAADDSYQVK